MSFNKRRNYTYIDDVCVSSYPEKDVLAAALEIQEMRAKRLSDALSSPGKVRQFCKATFTVSEESATYMVGLDNRHRVKAYRELFKGDSVQSKEAITQIIANCLAISASAIIFVKVLSEIEGKKESGTPISDSEVSQVKVWIDKLSLIDVRVLDCIQYSESWQVSFAERGLM